MKDELKKHLWFPLGLMLLFLLSRYWGAAEGIISLTITASEPLILGCVIAYIVNILMTYFENPLSKIGFFGDHRGLMRIVAILLAFVSLVMIVGIICKMIIPELGACLQLLIQKLPGIMEKGFALLEENFGVELTQADELIEMLRNIDWKEAAGKLLQGIGGAFDAAVTVVGQVGSFMVTLVVGLVFSIYVLSGKESLGRAVNAVMDTYLKPGHCSRVRYICLVLDDCFHKFIVGQCVEAVILGVLCIIGMKLLSMPYATMIGTLIGFTALIPVAGAYIGGIVGFLMIATVSPIKAVGFIVFLVVLQQFEGNLIYPRVVGSSIGLPGIIVLASITVGGGVMGVLGMLLGVPLAAAAYRIVSDDIEARRAAKAGCAAEEGASATPPVFEEEEGPVFKAEPMQKPQKKKNRKK